MKQEKTTRQKRITRLTVIAVLLGVCIALGFLLTPSVDEALYPRKYQAMVEKYAKQYDVPVNLVYAVIRTESDFKSDAVSSAGAIGLMQMMPATFRWLTDDMLGECLEDEMLYDAECATGSTLYYNGWKF